MHSHYSIAVADSSCLLETPQGRLCCDEPVVDHLWAGLLYHLAEQQYLLPHRVVLLLCCLAMRPCIPSTCFQHGAAVLCFLATTSGCS